MANHKWKDQSVSKWHKQFECVKCGVWKDWEGGDMQCWVFWYPNGHKKHRAGANIYDRPECITKKT